VHRAAGEVARVAAAPEDRGHVAVERDGAAFADVFGASVAPLGRDRASSRERDREDKRGGGPAGSYPMIGRG
jgi:hypothetical protein